MKSADTWRDLCDHNPGCNSESECRTLDQMHRAADSSVPFSRFPSEYLDVLRGLVRELDAHAKEHHEAARQWARHSAAKSRHHRAMGEVYERRSSAVALALSRLES